MARRPLIGLLLGCLVVAIAVSMRPKPSSDSAQAEGAKRLKGTIRIDGSSTVFPITEAVAEEFQKTQPRVRITVGTSGTGGGFKKFANNETAISSASRPITANEAKKAADHGVEFIELPITYDGLSVVINPKNDFVKTLTLAQLKMIWQPGSKVKTWQDVNPQWPARNIKLYGPGPDSGTFDYFTEAVMGKARLSRSDYMSSEDDNVLVTGISGDIDALGYFGYAYYMENQSRLKVVSIDAGRGSLPPTEETIASNTYPLARPIYIYVNKKATEQPEVEAFVQFYLKYAGELSKEVGYVPLPKTMYDEVLKHYDDRITGSALKPH